MSIEVYHNDKKNWAVDMNKRQECALYDSSVVLIVQNKQVLYTKVEGQLKIQ